MATPVPPVPKSTRSFFPPPTYTNNILATLPQAEIENLGPKLKPLDSSLNKVLYEPGDTVEWGYFPEIGLISLIAVMKSGEQVEVGIVGHEGFVANSIVLGGSKATQRALVQSLKLTGYRMSAADLRESFNILPAFQEKLLRFVRSQAVMISQSAACNRLHEAEARLAKWLLMCQDRSNGESMAMTHEFMADMLGVRRTTVTLVAGTLHRAGLINYARGKMVILNRSELEQAACECYDIFKEQFEMLTSNVGV